MRFLSTRNKKSPFTLSEALDAGLSPDGGLFVPESFPKTQLQEFPAQGWADMAFQTLLPFFADDPLKNHLREICKEAFNFPIPLKRLDNNQLVLELFHGPTNAFKDVGARFLAATIARMPSADKPRLVLVATSGDTGGAVGCAFSQKSGFQVVILYPKGKISHRQETQLTCGGKNVKAFAINSDFDSCQTLVKQAFLNPKWKTKWKLISANSISLGRLLPQMVYYAGTSLQYIKQYNQKPSFIVPTGNLGNAMAAIWAKACGFPIEKVGFALNANRAIYDLLQTGKWQPLPTVTTLANAMDVGAASNSERLRDYFTNIDSLRSQTSAVIATDEQICEQIKILYAKTKYIICPHTATAFYAADKLDWQNAILVSTAHPAKFAEIVEPLIGAPVPLPKELSALLDLPTTSTTIDADLDTLFKSI